MKLAMIPVLALIACGALAEAPDWLACSTIANDAERLECFDSAARSAQPADTVPSPPNSKIGGLPPVPADLGAESMPGQRSDASKENEEFSATVTRCERRDDRRYVFYFSNGQVWKQSKSDRLHFRACDFDVAITRDFFGYKMQRVDESEKSIRIRRLR